MRALDRLCRAILALLVIIALSASGCATTATYNAAYVSTPAMPQGDKLAGKVLIFTERIDDETLFVGAPTSFSGGGTKLTIPLGVIAREIAATVFGDLFVDGAVKANALQGATGYRAVVKPKVSSFSYAYNQLKNLGFAITPSVVVSLEVNTLDATGTVLRRRTYDSGTVELPAYFFSGTPGEEIGRAPRTRRSMT